MRSDLAQFVLSLKNQKGIIEIMQDRIKELICVDGNRYFTRYGFYTCKVTVSETQSNLFRVRTKLKSEDDRSEIARVYRITGTLKAIEKEGLRLILDIHKWALLDRDADTYWVKKVQI
jgi:hypothetical protein